MNKRDVAILDWVKAHRPDVINLFETILQDNDKNEDFYAFLAIAFEAGRKFQSDNPNLELNNPSLYDPKL